MTDVRADDPMPLDDDERLPWLEAVEEDEDMGGPSAAKMIAFVVLGLVAIGLVVGGVFWMGNRDAGPATGEPEVIAAPAGDYKVKPADAGGMEVAGKGDTAFATSQGADPKGRINTGGMPEAPVKKAPAPAAQPKAAPSPTPKQTTPAPAAAPAPGGATIQLGAFSSQASATNAWKAISTRFKYLAPLGQSVTPTTSGDRTLYRLRASGPGAADLCGRLRVAGESCVVID